MRTSGSRGDESLHQLPGPCNHIRLHVHPHGGGGCPGRSAPHWNHAADHDSSWRDASALMAYGKRFLVHNPHAGLTGPTSRSQPPAVWTMRSMRPTRFSVQNMLRTCSPTTGHRRTVAVESLSTGISPGLPNPGSRCHGRGHAVKHRRRCRLAPTGWPESILHWSVPKHCERSDALDPAHG